MKKLALLAVAAAFLTPAMISAASAETASVNLRVGSPGYRSHAQERVIVNPSHCRTIISKTRHNGKLIVKKVRKCG
jgi:hypothetical protein